MAIELNDNESQQNISSALIKTVGALSVVSKFANVIKNQSNKNQESIAETNKAIVQTQKFQTKSIGKFAEKIKTVVVESTEKNLLKLKESNKKAEEKKIQKQTMLFDNKISAIQRLTRSVLISNNITQSLVSKVSNLNTNAKGLLGKLSQSAISLIKFVPGIGLAARAISAAGRGISALMSPIQGLVGGIRRGFGNVSRSIGRVATGVFRIGANVVAGIGRLTGRITGAITGAIRGAFGVLSNMISAFVPQTPIGRIFFGGFLKSIATFFATWMLLYRPEQFRTGALAFLNFFTKTVPTIFGNVKTRLESWADNLGFTSVLTAITTKIKDSTRKAFEWITGEPVKGQPMASLRSLFDFTKEKLVGAFEWIRSDDPENSLKGTIDKIKDTFSRIVEGLISFTAGLPFGQSALLRTGVSEERIDQAQKNVQARRANQRLQTIENQIDQTLSGVVKKQGLLDFIADPANSGQLRNNPDTFLGGIANRLQSGAQFTVRAAASGLQQTGVGQRINVLTQRETGLDQLQRDQVRIQNELQMLQSRQKVRNAAEAQQGQRQAEAKQRNQNFNVVNAPSQNTTSANQTVIQSSRAPEDSLRQVFGGLALDG